MCLKLPPEFGDDVAERMLKLLDGNKEITIAQNDPRIADIEMSQKLRLSVLENRLIAIEVKGTSVKITNYRG